MMLDTLSPLQQYKQIDAQIVNEPIINIETLNTLFLFYSETVINK